MDTIQIYPAVEQGYDRDTTGDPWYTEAVAAAEKAGFDRGVLVTFWFFYKLFNLK